MTTLIHDIIYAADKLLIFSDASTYSETESILERTKLLSSELSKQGDPEVLAVVAGLCASRTGRTRVQREELTTVGGKRRAVVRNYGAGGTGYQAGYGMAMDAVKLADDILEDSRHNRGVQSLL